jgi:UDP-N-acetylglucosamine 2-epimerase (non-hydrolysing)
MKVMLVAGARPNFMKIAPIYHHSMDHDDVQCRIVHTGQHYDYSMSEAFFEDLELPEPHCFLGVGSGSHAAQTGRIMIAFEELCERERPDLVMVVGDVNSTLACSIVASKLMIQLAHVEAGLRSFDRSMPEEINRIVTDSLSDHFFVSEMSGLKNLAAEGKPTERIHFVGNVMIDNLLYQLEKLNDGAASDFPTSQLKDSAGPYGFLTLHRPSNVDCRSTFEEIASALNDIAHDFRIFFPIHPRTRQRMESFQVKLSENIILLNPLGFRESLALWKDARLVLTDSGGLQEETTALGVPCVTLRKNTERPITVEMGTNVLGGTEWRSILDAVGEALGKPAGARRPPLWDGRSAERIWAVLQAF